LSGSGFHCMPGTDKWALVKQAFSVPCAWVVPRSATSSMDGGLVVAIWEPLRAVG
jgi:hypothetical protein